MCVAKGLWKSNSTLPKLTKLVKIAVVAMEGATLADDPHFFQFNLDVAIRSQLIEFLEQSPLLPLTRSMGPQKSGVYALYWKNDLVYVGKATKEMTKSKRDLRMRL